MINLHFSDTRPAKGNTLNLCVVNCTRRNYKQTAKPNVTRTLGILHRTYHCSIRFRQMVRRATEHRPEGACAPFQLMFRRLPCDSLRCLLEPLERNSTPLCNGKYSLHSARFQTGEYCDNRHPVTHAKTRAS